MWLDADFEGGRSRNSRGKTLPSAVKEAMKMLEHVAEGQIAIFDAYAVGTLRGYVIKTKGECFFEEAKDE